MYEVSKSPMAANSALVNYPQISLHFPSFPFRFEVFLIQVIICEIKLKLGLKPEHFLEFPKKGSQAEIQTLR